jgi:hypothetical protein
MMTLLLSLALAAASGDPAGSAAGTTAPTAKPAKAKKICQRIESTGSSVPKKVCRTVEAPKVETEAANSAADKPSGNSTN